MSLTALPTVRHTETRKYKIYYTHMPTRMHTHDCVIVA